MSVAVRHRTCPRCGAAAEGSAWCQQCGLNLRVESSAEAEEDQRATHETRPLPYDAPPPAPERRGRLVAAAVLAAVLVAVVVVLAVVLLGRDDSGSSGKASHGPTVTPTATTTPAPAPAVTREQMAQVLVRYEDAYSNEDAGGLAAVFAPDLVRRNGTDAPEDRAAALAAYQDQFDHLTNPAYRLSGMTFTAGAADGVAAGSYTITSQAGAVTGQIGFHLVLQDGRLLIDRIVIRPS